VNNVVTITNLKDFVTELKQGLALFRKGSPLARKDGGCAQLKALVKLGEGVLRAHGMPKAEQGELLEPIRYLHAGIDELDRPVAPELPRRLESGANQVQEIYRHSNAALGMEFLDNWRHEAKRRRPKKYPALRNRFWMILRELEKHYPNDPDIAYAKLIEHDAAERGNGA
jgi:hypothetical protein